MNIVAQCCGLLVVLIIFYLSFRENYLMLSSRKIYFALLISTAICVSFDILSCAGIYYHDRVPEALTLALCKLYLSTLVLESFLGCMYTVREYFRLHKDMNDKIFKNALAFSVAAGLILPLVLPISYYLNKDDGVLYSYGPACAATYIFCVLYILITLFTCVFLMNNSNRMRRRVILIWQVIDIAAALFQMFFPQFLLVGFASCVGMFLLFSQLENPNDGIDKETGCFNMDMEKSYLNDRFQNGKNFSGMFIFVDVDDIKLDLDEQMIVMVYMANYFRSLKCGKVFRTFPNEFSMVFDDQKKLFDTYHTIKQNFSSEQTIPGIADSLKFHLRYYLLPESSILEKTEDVIRLHNYYNEMSDIGDDVIIDESAFESMHEFINIKKMIISALKENRIETFYQPIYSVKTGEFLSAEALVRIRKPDGGIVMPSVFIPVAERSGLIGRVGEEVFRQVCRLYGSGRLDGLHIKYIEINLSVAQFDSPDLVERFDSILREYKVSPDRINFEITESAQVKVKKTMLEAMRRLNMMGLNFSLDDFGTGRSNLDYFIDMPVNIVKFDRTFTMSYFTNIRTRYIMQTIIEMMQKMGLEIVIEGIETKEQFEECKNLNIDFVQGFYFSKPVPEDEFIEFLTDNTRQLMSS